MNSIPDVFEIPDGCPLEAELKRIVRSGMVYESIGLYGCVHVVANMLRTDDAFAKSFIGQFGIVSVVGLTHLLSECPIIGFEAEAKLVD